MVVLAKPGAYKQPSKVNVVSITLFLMMWLAIYIGYSFWPALSLNADVKSLIDDALPVWYRTNLYLEPGRTKEKMSLRTDLIKKIKKLKGMEDPHFEVTYEGDKKRVSIQVDFEVEVLFKGIDKIKKLTFHPRNETDAARVQWD